MLRTTSTRPPLPALVVAWCAVIASGCASWQLPRIDPSGERLFIWPGEPVPVPVGPAVPGPAVAPPIVAPAPLPGNVDVPPVYPDAGLSVGPPVAPPVIAPAAAPPPAATVAPPPPGAVIVGREHLQLSPQQVMAPVGTEVVLKAGICTASSYLLANHRVEWLLARDGAGQFVDLGGRGELDVFSWPWDTPRKVDNWYAIGSTSGFPICLRRGTVDPNDDLQIQRGEAWISVTSPAEGTSYVTAYAPLVEDWQLRQATATIHWVDAQWIFPPSAVVEAGRPHVLTTNVARRTNGVPIAGWIVRYEISGDGGSLGYAGENIIEVPTDATGRASVEVSPTDGGGGTAVVNIVLVRPGQLIPNVGEPLEVGRGVATITWATEGVTAPPSIPSPSPPATFEPPSPRELAPSGAYTPPPDQPPPGKPQLRVDIRRITPEPARVGEFVRFEVTVTNVGDGTARDIHVKDTFDPELSHPSAKPNTFSVEYGGMRDLEPGDSATVPSPLTFEVLAVGRPCHEVSVTCEGAEPATASACVSAVAPPPAVEPTLDVKKQGPDRHYIGEFAKFKTVIRNTGTVPVTNLRVVDQYDAALEVRVADPGYELLDDGRLEWRIDRLGAGELREFNVQCACVAQSASACSRVLVTGDGVNVASEKCVEILPLVEPPPAATNVTLSIVESSVSTRVGERMTVFIRAENTGSLPARDVAVRVLVPQEMTPDLNRVQPRGRFEQVGEREIRFTPLDSLRPQERAEFVIPVHVDQTGVVNVRAQLRLGDASPTDVQSKPIQILPASPEGGG